MSRHAQRLSECCLPLCQTSRAGPAGLKRLKELVEEIKKVEAASRDLSIRLIISLSKMEWALPSHFRIRSRVVLQTVSSKPKLGLETARVMCDSPALAGLLHSCTQDPFNQERQDSTIETSFQP